MDVPGALARLTGACLRNDGSYKDGGMTHASALGMHDVQFLRGGRGGGETEELAATRRATLGSGHR